MTSNGQVCVMLVAAEASGDNLGAALADALAARLGPSVRFVGVGGPRMAEAGVESPFAIAELSILGLVEGLMAYPRVRRRAAETADLAVRERPDIAVLIDSWGFTLRVAQRLRRRLPDLPLVKYVGPQVWASRPGRAKTLAATVDHLLTLHAFDAPYFEREGLATTFVGSSALTKRFQGADSDRLRAHIGAGPDDPILLVLLGSRPSEVARLSAPFGDAVRRLAADRPSLKLVVPVASTVSAQVRAEAATWPVRPSLVEDEGLKADAFVAATAALACSGSVTTELALASCPVVVGYRLSAMTHAILKRLITTRYITLFNIAAGREVAPELVQDRCTGPDLAAAVARLLDDPKARKAQIDDQAAALNALGRRDLGDPAERAADAVISMLKEKGRL
jgi:lipid-A-disaccharide synthase